MLSLPLLFLSLLPQALACPDHSNHIAPMHSKRQAFNQSNLPRPQSLWAYEASYNWGKLSPDYYLCQNGTQQSPIGVSSTQGLSNRHFPIFNYQGNQSGEYFNWGYGQAFTNYHPEGNLTTLPTLRVDNETFFMTGWHIHAPADHIVSGIRSRAELHYVHYDAARNPRAVLAIRIDPGRSESPFFKQLPPAVGFNDTSSYRNVNIDLYQAIREVDGFNEFWTYRGSLTSPPCKEGVRFFIARSILFVSPRQLQEILGVSTYSARAEQNVWLHDING